MSLPEHCYNPSLIRFQGQLLMTCRAHDRKDWRTNLYLATLSPELKCTGEQRLEMPSEYATHSHEDARLFVFRRELWMSWTIGRPGGDVHRCVVAFAKLSNSGGVWTVGVPTIPKHGQNDFSAMEKNWLFFEHENDLWCYYATDERGHGNHFIRLNQGQVAEKSSSSGFPWAYGPIHGGAIARRPDGRLLFFFNSRTGTQPQSHRYHIGCAELEGKPPFSVLRASKKPILYGQEGYNLDRHPFFKPNVVFASGALEEGERILLAFGYNDAACRVARLKEAELNL